MVSVRVSAGCVLLLVVVVSFCQALGSDRDPKTIGGIRNYPSPLEKRYVKVVHADGGKSHRHGRKLGGGGKPLGLALEQRVLVPVANSEDNLMNEADEETQQLYASKLGKILFPQKQAEDVDEEDTSYDINHVF